MSSGDCEGLALDLVLWPGREKGQLYFGEEIQTQNVNILHFNEAIIQTQSLFIFSIAE